MTTMSFITRTIIFLLLIGMSFFDWRRTKVLEQLIQFKDALIQSMERTALEQSTEQMIQQARSATDGVFQIHTPAKGSPEDWTAISDLFKEENGTARPGCILVKSQNGQGGVDYLLPGESVGLSITIPFPDPKRKL